MSITIRPPATIARKKYHAVYTGCVNSFFSETRAITKVERSCWKGMPTKQSRQVLQCNHLGTECFFDPEGSMCCHFLTMKVSKYVLKRNNLRQLFAIRKTVGEGFFSQEKSVLHKIAKNAKEEKINTYPVQ